MSRPLLFYVGEFRSERGGHREPQFLFQRISVAIQRFNAVLLHDGFSDHPD